MLHASLSSGMSQHSNVGVTPVFLPGAAESDLQRIVHAHGLFEDPPHGVAEVALDLKDQRRRPGEIGLPGENLIGEGRWNGNSPTSSDGTGSLGESSHGGSVPRPPAAVRGWSETLQTDRPKAPKSSPAGAGAA